MLTSKQPRHKLPSRKEQLQIANHLFFITAFLFVAHQNVLGEAPPALPELPQVAQAANMVPRTPPPVYDVDQLTTDEIEVIGQP